MKTTYGKKEDGSRHCYSVRIYCFNVFNVSFFDAGHLTSASMKRTSYLGSHYYVNTLNRMNAIKNLSCTKYSSEYIWNLTGDERTSILLIVIQNDFINKLTLNKLDFITMKFQKALILFSM